MARARSLGKKMVARPRSATAEKIASQNAVYATPWVLLIFVLIAGQGTHVLWPGWGLPQLGIAALTGVVAWIGWTTSHEHSLQGRLYASVTVVLAGSWLTYASSRGVFDPTPVNPVFDLWILIGSATALAWNQRQGARIGDAQVAEVREAVETEYDRIGLAGVRDNIKRVDQWRSVGDLTLPPGTTLDHVQARARELESAMGWPRHSVTLENKPGYSRKVRVNVQHADPLAKPIAWPGLVRGKKKSMFDPIPAAMSADGTIAEQLVAQPSGPLMTVVQGMTGAGKGWGEFPAILECADRGAVHWIIDTRKKTQTYGRIAPVLDWLIVEQSTARAALKRLADYTIPARTDYLASEGKTEWDGRSYLSFLRLIVEEAWTLVDSSELAEIGLACRSAGIQLIISLQRASHDMINTTLREQMAIRKCYGLGGDWGVSILDPEVVDAGADPTRWRNNYPGKLYLDASNLTLAQRVMPMRAFGDPADPMFENPDSPDGWARVATEIGTRLRPLDEVTVESSGELYTRRTMPVDLVVQARKRRESRLHPVSEPEPEVPVVTLEPELFETSGKEEEDDDMTDYRTPTWSDAGDAVTLGSGNAAERYELTTPNPDPGIIPDPDVLIGERPDDRDQVVWTPTKKDTKPEYQAKMDAQLVKLKEWKVVTYRDFAGVVSESGYSRGAVYRTFEEWTEAGLLARTDDGWLPVKELIEKTLS